MTWFCFWFHAGINTPELSLKKRKHLTQAKHTAMTLDYECRLTVCLTTALLLLSNCGSCFELTILHTNDVHARIQETNVYGGRCSAQDSAAKKCFGGVARRQTVINQIRKSDRNVLLLDAGDQFQGTVWFNVYEGTATADFMNMLRYDAMVSA